MKPLWIIIRHEIVTMLGKRSFWLTTFLLPIFVIALSFGSQVMANKLVDEAGDQELLAGSAPGEGRAGIGYVDEPGLLATLPPYLPPTLLQPYPDAAAAQAALAAGVLERYYLIPADYLQTGQVVVVEQQYNPMSRFSGVDIMQLLLEYNLSRLADTPELLLDPLPNVIQESVTPPTPGVDDTPTDESAVFLVTYATLMIFYVVLTMSSGFMLHSVSKEKENRVAEVLLLSLRPRALMLGKLIGLGAVALLQMGVWLGGSLLALDQGKQVFEIAQMITLPPGFLVWGLLYLLFGYLLYASALGAVGALAPTARESSQFTFFVLMPLMIPLFFITPFMEAPNGGMAVALSLFPLTAPVSMMTRMAAATVPFWQPAVGLALLALTAYGFVLLAARFFRADTLLSESSLDWRRLVAELRRK